MDSNRSSASDKKKTRVNSSLFKQMTVETKKVEKTQSLLDVSEETNIHPELARKENFAKLKPMQPVTDVSEISEILSKNNARMYVDIQAKEFSFFKVKR